MIGLNLLIHLTFTSMDHLGGKKKDTGDIIEEVLILKAALLTDLFDGLQKQHFTLWPVILQKHHHMSKGQVVTVVCEGAELSEQN